MTICASSVLVKNLARLLYSYKMKFAIIFACLLVAAYADDDVKVLHDENIVDVESFKYAFELDNHIKAIQEGILKDGHVWVVSGEYEYISPKGVPVHVSYVADDHGYHAKTQ